MEKRVVGSWRMVGLAGVSSVETGHGGALC